MHTIHSVKFLVGIYPYKPYQNGFLVHSGKQLQTRANTYHDDDNDCISDSIRKCRKSLRITTVVFFVTRETMPEKLVSNHRNHSSGAICHELIPISAAVSPVLNI